MAVRASFAAVLFALVTTGLSTSAFAQEGCDPTGFHVEFTDCVESIGVALLPIEHVRPLVPPGFILAGEGSPVTPIVVRTARCGGIAVDGKRARPGAVVQIGAVIIPPDFTGDINNYTLWYYTSSAQLASRLRRIGVPAQHVQRIDYDYEKTGLGDDPFHVSVPLPGRPAFRLDGVVTESEIDAGSFLANWWVGGPRGSVKMATLVPNIAIGEADLLLTTKASAPLGVLIGGASLGFPILQQFNAFPLAIMDVSQSQN